MSGEKPKLIVIVGPTASGKTDLALNLAHKFNGEIIAADSRTIYKEMNIATAKPRQSQTLKAKSQKHLVNGIPHYMIDVVRPDREFTVAEFKQKALKVIKGIHRRHKIPFLVGGSGLYVSSVVDNLDIPRVPPDKKLRARLEKEIVKYGLDYLWQKLMKLDPEAAIFVQKQNPRRIIRALEVCLKTKKPFSKLRGKNEPLFNCLQIGLKLSKQKLLKRIGQRTEQMLKKGLIDEVKELIKKYPSNLPSLNTIGYQEIIAYLKKEIGLNEAIDLIKKNTRQYARRQMTWFKKDKTIKWIKTSEEAEKLVKNFI